MTILTPALPARALVTTPLVRSPLAVHGVLLVVLVKCAVQLAFAGRYGWHRDELYYFAAGQHPAAGYVDFPPVTPWLARLSDLVFGPSLVGLRSFAVLAGAAVVVLGALTARELGGGRGAQILAAVAVGASPMLLGSNAMFQTVSFDQLAWASVLFLVVRLLRTADTRLWPAIGLAAGAGLMTKYTVGMLLASLAVGLALTASGRRHLRERGPWVAAVVTAAVIAPNLWWQARHGWASIEFLGTHVDEVSVGEYLFELLFFPGLLGLVLGAGGLLLLAGDARYRALAWTAGLVAGGFLLLGAKGYYAAPIWVVLMSAGAVRFERLALALTSRRRRLRLAAVPVLLALTIPVLPVGVPVLSERSMVARGLWELREDYAEQIGWPELVDTVAAAYHGLTPGEQAEAAILTANYGEAGAVDLLGGRHGLPGAVSRHLTYRYWTPPAHRDARILVVVGYHRDWLEARCATVNQVGVVRNRAGVPNEEDGRPVHVCRLPVGATLATVLAI